MKIINLTQHKATADQIAEGVIDLHPEVFQEVKRLLDFKGCPKNCEVVERAAKLAAIAAGLSHPVMGGIAMIGGVPYLMGPLEEALKGARVRAVFAHSDRVSVEEALPDGSVRKVSEFKHGGLVREVAVFPREFHVYSRDGEYLHEEWAESVEEYEYLEQVYNLKPVGSFW